MMSEAGGGGAGTDQDGWCLPGGKFGQQLAICFGEGGGPALVALEEGRDRAGRLGFASFRVCSAD